MPPCKHSSGSKAVSAEGGDRREAPSEGCVEAAAIVPWAQLGGCLLLATVVLLLSACVCSLLAAAHCWLP